MSQLGPAILARTLSVPTRRGKSSHAWQYHSRSDHHSKLSCWGVILDLLASCDVVRRHAEEDLISVAVNHQMVGPINKTLDLVICKSGQDRKRSPVGKFRDLVSQYNIHLSCEEEMKLNSLPDVSLEESGNVSEVLIALEAKACMTQHSKSMPRLHAEILATGFLARQAAPNCITASYTVVNASETFLSPGKSGEPNSHNSSDCKSVIDMIRDSVPRKQNHPSLGYNAIGVSAICCKNDGSPVLVLGDGVMGAPRKNDFLHYERMISSICSDYRDKFSAILR
jgi:hypothetical protein